MSPETPFLANEVAGIREQQEDQAIILRLLLEPNRPDLCQQIMERSFGGSSRRAQVYLAIRPGKTSKQIADEIGMKDSNVRTEIHHLREAGLVERTQDGTYRQKLEKFLGLAVELRKRFSL